jgi:NAD(P)-dependent dehydrogenase (short-subunit alcohol dehydrogenase family)
MGTDQKVAVITGASQGIGAALVRAYRSPAGLSIARQIRSPS